MSASASLDPPQGAPAACTTPELEPWRRLQRALHPLHSPPTSDGWNFDEVVGLLEPGARMQRAAVLLGIVERPQGNQVLLTRRTERLARHPGQIAFPGGRVDAADASDAAAALREAQEEVALAPEHVEPLGFIDPLVTLTGFRVMPLVARVAPAHLSVAQPSEVDEVFEVPLDFLLDVRNCERVDVDYRGTRRHYWQFNYGSHIIWGATASMLVNLRDRLSRID